MLVILNKKSKVYYKICRNMRRGLLRGVRGIIFFGGDVVSECGFILHLEAVGYSIMLILIHKSRWCYSLKENEIGLCGHIYNVGVLLLRYSE